jgi:primosomal replication protein N
MREGVVRFVKARRMPLEVVAGEGGEVRVVTAEERRRCGGSRLYVGGFIACESARAMAGRLGLRISQMGQLLDFLNIKVRNCGLGCFK